MHPVVTFIGKRALISLGTMVIEVAISGLVAWTLGRFIESAVRRELRRQPGLADAVRRGEPVSFTLRP